MTDTSQADSPSTQTEPTPPASSRRLTPSGLSGASVVRFLEAYALVLITVAVAIFFSVAHPASIAFPTINNVNVVLGNNAVVLLLALAALFPLVSGSFDFSLGSTAVFSSVLYAGLQAKSGLPLVVAIMSRWLSRWSSASSTVCSSPSSR